MANNGQPPQDTYDWARDIPKFEGDLKDLDNFISTLDDIWELSTSDVLKQRFMRITKTKIQGDARQSSEEKISQTGMNSTKHYRIIFALRNTEKL